MDKEYIEKQALIEAFEPERSVDWYTPWIVDKINEQPTADVVEVVRCHNCEYHGIRDKCPLLNMSPYRDDERGYCSEGKRLE